MQIIMFIMLRGWSLEIKSYLEGKQHKQKENFEQTYDLQ